MLATLPIWIRLPILLCVGAVLGAFINWAIYSWAMFRKRSISPWMKPAEGASSKGLDRVPIIGWINLRRHSEIHGKGFWFRPMMIEIIFAIGVPWFYQWQLSGGLLGGAAIPAFQAETWFVAHGILIVLMCIGTFIDFDEKTIPDEVTLPGTLIALFLATFVPWFHLPEMNDAVMLHLNYASPLDMPVSHRGTNGLLICLAIWGIWIWALLPKLPFFYVGWGKFYKFMFAHALQPKRKTKCEFRTKQRSTPGVTIFLGVLLVVGILSLVAAWSTLAPANVDSLFTSMVGMAFGAGLVWSIRIIGTFALKQEAMGFGDVTLMAMVGAFMGWQAAMLTFVIAPFAALAVVFIQFVITRQNEIAFGPYLCAGATILLFGWHAIWSSASQGVFALGPVLLGVLAVALVLMGVMLVGIQWFKAWLFKDDQANGTVR